MFQKENENLTMNEVEGKMEEGFGLKRNRNDGVRCNGNFALLKGLYSEAWRIIWVEVHFIG